MKTSTHARFGLIVGGVVLAAALLATRVAVSGKASDTATAPPINTGPSPMPAPGGCDNGPSFDLAQKLIGQVIDATRWTAKDRERIAPLFFGLHTDQKIELLKRIGAALDTRRLSLEKGTRLF